MKKILFIILVILVVTIFPSSVFAQSGCCSHHGGVAGCEGGRQLCNDGTLSPSCTCYDSSSSTSSYDEDTYNYNFGYSDTEDSEISDGAAIIMIILFAVVIIGIIVIINEITSDITVNETNENTFDNSRCKNCYKQLPEHANYCPYCGIKCERVVR